MISAVVLTKNEEKNIKNCLQSLLWCDEVIVVDDNSTDRTVSVIKNSKLKIKIYSRYLNNNFAAQRNFGLKKAKNEWVLFLDADEIVSEKLAYEIQRKVREYDFDGYFVKRHDFFMNRELKHGECGNVKLLRLAKKNSGKWKRAVHETWVIKGRIGVLENQLQHFPHQTIREFIDDINMYSTLHAIENKKENKVVSPFKIIFFPVIKFLKSYIIQLGFIDGTAGFIMSLMMSFHSFLAWSKLWFI